MNPNAEPSSRALSLERSLWVLLAAGTLVRVILLFWLSPFYDDAFITFRFAQNLASGAGLVFNEGERVLGTSTPFFAVLLGVLHKLTTISIPALGVGIGLLCFPISFIGFNKLLVVSGLTSSQRGWVLVLFSFIPSLVLANIAGMESGLVVALMVWGAYLLFKGSNYSGVVLGILVLTRIDAVAFVGVVMLVSVLANRKVPWRSSLIFSLVVGAWFVFATWYYGSPIPNTAVAKMVAQPDTAPLPERLHMGVAYYLKTTSALRSLVFVPAFLLGAFYSFKTKNFVSLGFLIFLVLYILAFAIPGAPVFPWYMVPGNVAVSVLVGLGYWWATALVMAGRNERFQYEALALLSAFLCSWVYYDASKTWLLMKISNTRVVGEHIAGSAPGKTAFAEPAGAIGYYCSCRLIDNIGLVSPKVVDYYKRPGGRPRWFSTAFREIKPDVVIFRQIEIDENKLFPEMTPLFTPEEWAWFERTYERKLVANPPEYDKTIHRFYVYHHR